MDQFKNENAELFDKLQEKKEDNKDMKFYLHNKLKPLERHS